MFKKIVLLIVTICFIANNAKAQDVYYAEIGIIGGGGFTLGDTNNFLFKYMQPTGCLYAKYKINGRIETKLQLEGGLLGYNKNQKTSYATLQALGEFNFLDYGAKKWDAYYSWFTPSLIAGLGAIVFDFQDNPKMTLTVPLGIGFKFKLSERVNVGTYWMVNKVLSDKLDKSTNPNGEYGKFWNNQDWYSTAQIFLSFNFYKTCAPCRNSAKPKKREWKL